MVSVRLVMGEILVVEENWNNISGGRIGVLDYVDVISLGISLDHQRLPYICTHQLNEGNN